MLVESFDLRLKKTKIQELFVACTKLDVSMNSLLMRGKNLVYTRSVFQLYAQYFLRFKLYGILPIFYRSYPNLPPTISWTSGV